MISFIEFIVPVLVWIVGFGYVSYKFKDQISAWFIRNVRFPEYVNFFLLSSPFIIVEELLTCRPIMSLGCLPTTFPAFHIMLGGLYIIWRLTKLNYLTAAILFGLWGAVNEMLILGKHFVLPIHISVLFWILVIPIYAITALVPMYYLEKSSKV